jgi:hypothetical protein
VASNVYVSQEGLRSMKLACVFVATVTFLTIRCPATAGDTQTDGRIYAVCRWDGLRRHIYISYFIKIGSGIQKLTGGIHRQHGDLINLLHLFEIRKVTRSLMELSPS